MSLFIGSMSEGYKQNPITENCSLSIWHSSDVFLFTRNFSAISARRTLLIIKIIAWKLGNLFHYILSLYTFLSSLYSLHCIRLQIWILNLTLPELGQNSTWLIYQHYGHPLSLIRHYYTHNANKKNQCRSGKLLWKQTMNQMLHG